MEMVKRPTPELDRLFRRVRKATKPRGARARLAAELGVLPPTLSDWLRGRYEPGGEITLKLQNWVDAAEDEQQKKAPPWIAPTTARKTRKDKSTTNEKANPGQRPKR